MEIYPHWNSHLFPDVVRSAEEDVCRRDDVGAFSAMACVVRTFPLPTCDAPRAMLESVPFQEMPS
jgi:hypothetical protein